MSDLITCGACGATNRVAAEKVARRLRPVCGRCKAPLRAAPAAPIVVGEASFAELVERAPMPVLVDAWAPWCGPCRMIAPVIDQLAAELAERVRVAKLNVDENPGLAARFNLRSIPTLLILQGGREVDRLVGAQPKEAILRHLRPLLS